MGTVTQEVWEEPDPIKVVALNAAVRFHSSTAVEVVSNAKIFESYLREPDKNTDHQE